MKTDRPDPPASAFEALGHETPAEDLDALCWLAQVAADHALVRGATAPITALEVGSWTGRTALVLAAVFDRVYCVDHFLGNPHDRLGEVARRLPPGAVFEAFCRNCSDRLFDTIFPLMGASRTWAAAWPAGRALDLIFIDGSHEYADCYEDLASWTPHVRPGGIVVVHDRGIFPGVDRALAELLPHHRMAGATIAYQIIR